MIEKVPLFKTTTRWVIGVELFLLVLILLPSGTLASDPIAETAGVTTEESLAETGQVPSVSAVDQDYDIPGLITATQTVAEIIDGDIFIFANAEVLLTGTNTPEVGQPYYAEGPAPLV
jgi:endonuclease YncB( thermonuclease family)